MLNVSSLPTVSSVGKFLHDSGYDVAHLSRDLDLSDGLFANQENLEPLLAKTEGDSLLALLARLFFVCWHVDESICRRVLSDSFVNSAFECGLLTKTSEGISSSACLVPFRDHILACDSSRTRSTLTDMVTGPSASTGFIARMAAGGQDETTLDLGTGTGALSLEASHYSRSVIGTDINPRTLQFAEFNAALNGITNIEWRQGDAFEPAAGQRFSRIVANPPFFLSPVSTFTYCDSPLELDGFTARLARECSNYLEEGGFYQMICEWVEIEGQSWEDRLREWTSQSGCDVLVLIAPQLTPLAYAEKRTRETRLMQSSALEHSFTDRLRYLRDRQVRHVVGGVISMRKRTGASNWFSITGTDPVGDYLGADVRARFASHTLLATASDDELFAKRMQLANDVVLDNRAAFSSGGWHTTKLDLLKQSGLVDRLRLDEIVASFLPLFDGRNSLAEMAATVSERLEISAEEAQKRCLQLARRLLQSNFIEVI